MMNNQEAAKMFIEAIKQLASKEDNLDNFECYLTYHFDKWLEWLGGKPENLIAEIRSFANMED